MVAKLRAVSKGSVPWVAIVIAVLGWNDARDSGEGEARMAQEFAEQRAAKAWTLVHKLFHEQQDQINDLRREIDQLEIVPERSGVMKVRPVRPATRRGTSLGDLPADYSTMQKSIDDPLLKSSF